jgi:hypothetical protein
LKILVILGVLFIEQVVSLPILFVGLFLIWGMQLEEKYHALWVIGWGVLMAIVWGWSWWLGVLALFGLWLVWTESKIFSLEYLLGVVSLVGLVIFGLNGMKLGWQLVIYLILGVAILIGAWRATLVDKSKVKFYA